MQTCTHASTCTHTVILAFFFSHKKKKQKENSWEEGSSNRITIATAYLTFEPK